MKKTNAMKKWQIILISPVCMILGLLLIYLIKGVYPFGDGNIAYYDMAQSYVPLYYHTWDFLHGDKSIFFDWFSGAGGSLVDNMANFILNPFNLLLYFVKRENILGFMSIFLVIKVAFAAGAMSFYSVQRYKKIDNFWHVLVGVIYASCGYFLQYYTNIHFLDIVVVFPLLVWSYERLIYDNKNIAYVILMTYCCFTNIYFSGLFCPFLILYGAMLLREISDKKEQQRVTLRIALYTLSSILISCVTAIPMYLTLNNSIRGYLSDSITYMQMLSLRNNDYFGQKFFMLFGSELSLAIAIIYCVKEKKNGLKKYAGKYLLLALFLIPIFVESVNSVLHIVGYVEFPMRFGYILSFVALTLMEDIVQGEYNFEDKSNYKKEIDIELTVNGKEMKETDSSFMTMLSVAIVPFSLFIFYSFAKNFLTYGINDLLNYKTYWICLLLLIVVYVFACFAENKKVSKWIIIITMSCQLFIGWYGFLAPTDSYHPEGGTELVWGSEEIRASAFYESDTLDRIKDSSVTMSANYPFILQKASMSNWTWGTGNQLVFAMVRLGYSQAYTRISDTGGTIFSDMLLNIKETITTEKPDAFLYSTYGETEHFYLNKFNYEYPFGMFVDESFLEWDQTNCDSGLVYQNELFLAITGEKTNLIDAYAEECFFVSGGYDEEQQVYYYDYRIPIEGNKVIYLERYNYLNNYMIVKVNGDAVKIPTLQQDENYIHPTIFNNGFIECGRFKDEVVDLHIECAYEKPENDIIIGLLDLNVLKASVNSKSDEICEYETTQTGLYIKKVVEEDGYVFVPIGYSDNWNAYVNGTQVPVRSGINNAFVFVPVSVGVNEVELRYSPAGFDKGILVMLVGILLLIVGIITGKKIEKNEICSKAIYICYMALVWGILILGYIIPLIGTVVFSFIT